MRMIGLMLAAASVASCSEEMSPEEQRTADAADIAAVEALQTPPPQPIVPQPIGYPDIEKHNLYGAGCSFAPEGGGLGAIALAQTKAGYMKIDNAIQRFAPDVGSAEMPLGTRAKYDGTSNSFRLSLLDEKGKQSGMETVDFKAHLVVRNSSDAIVYEADGIAQCGS